MKDDWSVDLSLGRRVIVSLVFREDYKLDVITRLFDAEDGPATNTLEVCVRYPGEDDLWSFLLWLNEYHTMLENAMNLAFFSQLLGAFVYEDSYGLHVRTDRVEFDLETPTKLTGYLGDVMLTIQSENNAGIMNNLSVRSLAALGSALYAARNKYDDLNRMTLPAPK